MERPSKVKENNMVHKLINECEYCGTTSESNSNVCVNCGSPIDKIKSVPVETSKNNQGVKIIRKSSLPPISNTDKEFTCDNCHCVFITSPGEEWNQYEQLRRVTYIKNPSSSGLSALFNLNNSHIATPIWKYSVRCPECDNLIEKFEPTGEPGVLSRDEIEARYGW
jgi:hypothetical protein